MTVAELIEKLKEMPQEKIVLVFNECEDGPTENLDIEDRKTGVFIGGI